MRRLRLLLDANILVDAQLRDLFFTFADLERIEVYWSEVILQETRRAMIQNIGRSASDVDSLLNQICRAFPNSVVEGFESTIESLVLPDRDDRHVLAAALEGECDHLVTINLKDFPPTQISDADLLVSSPDDALLEVVGSNGPLIQPAIDAILARMRRPAIALEPYLERLSGRAPLSAMIIGAHLKVESYVQLWDDYRASADPRSPQYAVRSLLTALDDEDEAALVQLIAPELRASLVNGANTLLQGLQVPLAPVLNSTDWGLATAPRIHAPDVELVRLVFGSFADGVQVFNQATLVPSYCFVMRQLEGRWVLQELNPPEA